MVRKKQKMQKNKTATAIAYVPRAILFIIILALLSAVYSCEKKEPAAKPDPGEIMKKIAEDFPEYNSKDINYDSGEKSKELQESKATELYSDDKNKPVDLSKIEKYSIKLKSKLTDADEIGIFKLYDKVNAEYVKDMAQTRISKIQENGSSNPDTDTDISEILNNAEIRSYGNYVYYVSHPQKDKIFEIIENALRGM